MNASLTKPILLLAAAVGAAAAAQAQTAIGSTLNLSAFADANTGDSLSATQTYANSQGATLNTLTGSAFATNTVAGTASTITAGSSATASWTNAGQGTLAIRNNGFNVATSTPYKYQVDTAQSGLWVWTYTFQATTNGTFNLAYSVVGTGSTFGLQGVYGDWSGAGGGFDFTDPSNPSASGSISRAVVAGQQYTISVGTYSNLTSNGGATTAGSFNADLSFRLNPVPEPLGIAALGMGLVGLLGRRRRGAR